MINLKKMNARNKFFLKQNLKNFFTRKDTDPIGLLHEINELRSNMKICIDKA